ncbi:conserved hypothetical protein [Theileria equi strain WA]|uniref:Uncharacterized protein n=1 Tax=Theileria equi strain WA TaxID=1537102 RepID=L1LGB0_THEEQ|nr:conserved hypothetical protein [Theileria equi strain WA]EKX74275.1 conserved hypothetical protein [Theileria equi strain WA]|eukprot:XP_004833727.1 conserved hypothetical protein [Theileria equi strain WA]
MTTEPAPAQQTPTRQQGNWFVRLLFQLVLFRLIYSYFSGPGTTVDPYTGLPPDIYACVTNDNKLDFENLENSGKIVFSRENQLYTHKRNNPFDQSKVTYKAHSKFYNDQDEPLYIFVFLIPHKAYEIKVVPFYKSTFKDGFEGHYIVKTLPLTKMKHITSSGISLMGNEDEDGEIIKEEVKHWIPRLDINLVYDLSDQVYSGSNPYFDDYTKHFDQGVFDPLLNLSQFWVLNEHYVHIESDNELDLTINYSTCSPMYYLLTNHMKNTGETKNRFGRQSNKEFDMLKRTLMTTNIYMLIFSACFILLHTLFSAFALKNDIQFWKNNDSMEGLSALSIIINFICDIIIGLYIFDSEEKSWLLLFEIALGVCASGWKVTKAVKIHTSLSYPFIRFESSKNYVESKTKEYDEIAIKYMSIAMTPCIVGYAIYSLYYLKHKSWYSYIISVAAGSVYTFGFIMMTPQLYINYKLQSVEHLPWRALIYKALNTFVDDVASFLIEMPWLHRLSCFRDDIIFFCYIYQRWKYRVDPSRNDWEPKKDGEAPALQNLEEVAPSTNITDDSDSKDTATRRK